MQSLMLFHPKINKAVSTGTLHESAPRGHNQIKVDPLGATNDDHTFFKGKLAMIRVLHIGRITRV